MCQPGAAEWFPGTGFGALSGIPIGLRSPVLVGFGLGPGATALTVMPVEASSVGPDPGAGLPRCQLAAAYGVRSGVPRVVKLVGNFVNQAQTGGG